MPPGPGGPWGPFLKRLLQPSGLVESSVHGRHRCVDYSPPLAEAHAQLQRRKPHTQQRPGNTHTTDRPPAAFIKSPTACVCSAPLVAELLRLSSPQLVGLCEVGHAGNACVQCMWCVAGGAWVGDGGCCAAQPGMQHREVTGSGCGSCTHTCTHTHLPAPPWPQMTPPVWRAHGALLHQPACRPGQARTAQRNTREGPHVDIADVS